MNGSDSIYVLSSDEDEPPSKRKRIEPILISAPKINAKTEIGIIPIVPSSENTVICLESDEEGSTDSQDVIIVPNDKIQEVTKYVIKENEKEEKPNKPEETVEEVFICDSTTENIEDVGDISEKSSSDATIIDKASECPNEGEGTSSEHLEETVSTDDDPSFKNIENLPSEAVNYLTMVKNKLEGSKNAPHIFKKFPSLIKMFKALENEFSKSDYFKNFINKQTTISSESEKSCIISFRDVYEHLKTSLNSEGIELSKKHWKHVRMLEKVMKKLLKKLDEFDEAEVDFDGDEDDSPYLKHERYSKRLSTVYKKYCKILKKNPYAGRITHERLEFVSSQYNEINLAISKKYKNNSVFPSFDELSAYIHSVAEEKNLNLSAVELKIETEFCFKKLGDLLQTRRKKELYESHCGFILNEEDPADKDEGLDTKLRISSKEGKVKIEQVCEEFVRKQEMGACEEEIDCELEDEGEDDEDNGNRESSDDED